MDKTVLLGRQRAEGEGHRHDPVPPDVASATAASTPDARLTSKAPLFEPHPAKSGYYVVCLGGGTYEVDAESGFCNCPGFQFRGKCKHGHALADYLEAERACPLCQGYGRVGLRNVYQGEAPVCVICEGTGLKSHGLSDADLRDIFA